MFLLLWHRLSRCIVNTLTEMTASHLWGANKFFYPLKDWRWSCWNTFTTSTWGQWEKHTLQACCSEITLNSGSTAHFNHLLTFKSNQWCQEHKIRDTVAVWLNSIMLSITQLYLCISSDSHNFIILCGEPQRLAGLQLNEAQVGPSADLTSCMMMKKESKIGSLNNMIIKMKICSCVLYLYCSSWLKEKKKPTDFQKQQQRPFSMM